MGRGLMLEGKKNGYSDKDIANALGCQKRKSEPRDRASTSPLAPSKSTTWLLSTLLIGSTFTLLRTTLNLPMAELRSLAVVATELALRLNSTGEKLVLSALPKRESNQRW